MPSVGGKPSSSSDHFTLASTDGNFESRSNDVFASLDSIETRHTENVNAREEVDRPRSPILEEPPPLRNIRRSQERAHNRRGDNFRRDNFRRPTNRPPRRSHVPDFRRNPQNYTEYDLSTVEEHTERSNSSAAFSFLDELRKRRESKGQNSSDFETDPAKGKVWRSSAEYVRRKHPFSKPEKQEQNPAQPSSSREPEKPKSEATDTTEKAKFVDGKLTMPEYVVGQGKVSRKEHKSEGISCDALVLDHLGAVETPKEDCEQSDVSTVENVSSSVGESVGKQQSDKVHFKRIKRKGGTRKRTEDNDDD